ncbi:aminodeoxychorismate lyase [Paenibacillus protaetiae]|uniref:4-amino-4-deoxychorismate lyase n=1 Tax=Paenibacillus protaetiae TaxID=2509456 RepID=A0A4P6EXD5_9BACL|nr:aminodeoxychorismate lyase [Paenibacillus protaetiae]QAY67416.1 4-amino-4-deoxychorismate lyase [Paenibacillus protaetiae]
MKVGYNGDVVDAKEAVISVFDHGFLYGMGLFETFRTYGGKPYLLDRHMQRLAAGCRELGIRIPITGAEVREWLSRLLAANGLGEAYVRLTVSAGDAGLGLPSGEYEQPNVVLLVKPLPDVSEEVYRQGRELRLLKTARNTPEGGYRLKSLHYMNNILAKQELLAAKVSAGAEGLMLTREGRLAEGIVSNLFFVRDGKVCTPGLETGILPGITRQRVLELASEAGYETEEGLYGWDDLLQAAEVWTTGSVQELMPITKLTDLQGVSYQVGQGTAGPAASALLAAYRHDARNVKA